MAYGQTVVTLRGAISSLDSTRGNMILSANGNDSFVVLPTTVDIRWSTATGAALTRNNLREGMSVAVDAVKSPTGQLTAQSVIIIPPKSGVVPPSTPLPATDVTVNGESGTTVIPSGGASPPINHVSAVRAMKLGHEVGEVRVNGATVFRFRGVRGRDPYARAQTVAIRMNSASMANLRPGEIGVRRMNGEHVVVARGVGLITADTITARINHTTPVALAAQWANNLRRQLATAR